MVQNILLPRRNRASAQPLVTWLGFHHAAFYQLKSMMQGVLARGTARSIANFAPYVAGKTGTSDDGNEAEAPPLLQSHWRSRRDAPRRRDHRVLL